MPSPNADTKFVLSTYTQNLCVNLFFKVCTLVCQIDVHARLLILGVKVPPT